MNQLELMPVETEIQGTTKDLLELERTIERGLQTFIEIGQALIEVRDRRLYLLTHRTFEEYLDDRWNLKQSRAYQLMDAAAIVSNLQQSSTIVELPQNEAQTRPLCKLPPEQQVQAWEESVRSAPSGNVTASHVAATVQKYFNNLPVSVVRSDSGKSLVEFHGDGCREWIDDDRLTDTEVRSALDLKQSRQSEDRSLEQAGTYKAKRIANDYYPTPDPIVQILLDAVKIEGTVLEPCAGHGAIAKFFPDRITNEPYPTDEFTPDFGNDASDPMFWEALDGRFDWVVTNPPYESKAMLAIVTASLVHARKGVAMLVRLNYLEPCQDRAKLLQDYADNLRFFIPVSPRPQFRKDMNGSDNVTVAWVVWDKGWSWAKLGIDCPFVFTPGWR